MKSLLTIGLLCLLALGFAQSVGAQPPGGESDSIRRSLFRTIESDPDNADSYYTLGNYYFNLEDDEAAESCYLKSLELNPNVAIIYNNLGDIYMKRGNYHSAE